MKLSDLDVFLTWDDLVSLLNDSMPAGLAIYDMQSQGDSVAIIGTASFFGLSSDWSACLEPIESANGKCLVFQIESFVPERGFLFDFFTNWFRSREENLARFLAKRFGEGASAEGNQLWIDLPEFLSAKTDLNVRIGKVKLFRSNKRGLRLVIESARRRVEKRSKKLTNKDQTK